MEERTLTIVLIVLGAPVVLTAMWAMMMMTLLPLKDPRFTLFRLNTGYFNQEPYNRKYRRIFAACVFILIFLAIVFNVLFFSGFVERSDAQNWPRHLR